ncbi:hypothetical protein D3C76_469170 [compost metagenome]
MAMSMPLGKVPQGVVPLSVILRAVIGTGNQYREAVPADVGCQYRVVTLNGAPYEAIDDDGELIGVFDRKPDGAVWLRDIDTSVEDASECLKKKGFTTSLMEFISPR